MLQTLSSEGTSMIPLGQTPHPGDRIAAPEVGPRAPASGGGGRRIERQLATALSIFAVMSGVLMPFFVR